MSPEGMVLPGFLTDHVDELVVLALTLAVIFVTFFVMTGKTRRVYLVDFACYKPPESQSCSRAFTMDQAWTSGMFSERTLEFMEKVMERSGMGDSAYLPEGLVRMPLEASLEEALREARSVMFGAVEELLEKTGLEGSDIGILIVNCCLFCVSPSLSAMVVNEFKLRDDVISYNLQGMGCAAGLAAIELAQRLLQVHHNSYALILSTENITDGMYKGDDPSMILINGVFRVGGAAVLLSSQSLSRSTAKYELAHTVRTQTTSSDRSYNCIFRKEDDSGEIGVSVSKELLAVANTTIESNIATLGYLILPWSEKLKYAVNCLLRRFRIAEIEPYIPDFKKAVDHICTHVGGKPVLDEMQKSLHLGDVHMEASRMTLYRFGNTSSSSVWYELAYIEAKGRVKKGDMVWQIAFGSGFKCNSVVWRAIRAVGSEQKNPWSDEKDQYPVEPSHMGFSPYDYFEPSKQKVMFDQ